MKRIVVTLVGVVLLTWNIDTASTMDLQIQGKRLISQKPPFTLTLPPGFDLAHSFSHENLGEGSLTRVYFLVKAKVKQVEEMLILQIADKTNPEAGPMSVSSLKSYTEKRLYAQGKVKEGEIAVDYLIQLLAWNPEAPSLQPLVKKGFVVPSSWALQGQFLFLYRGEHAVFFRYSKDINSFGLKTSEKGKDWGKESISGNEKRVYETFRETFMEMINSIRINPR